MRPFPSKVNNKGLTLFEVLIAAFIIAILAGPFLGLYATNAKLVRSAYQRTDSNYKAKSLMETLYGLTYPQLFQKGVNTKTSADTAFPGTATGMYYTLTLSPGGPDGVVAGTECYFHLFVDSTGTGKFAGPGATGNLPTLSTSNLANLTIKAPTSGTTYSVHQGAATTTALFSGTKPAGTVPILLVITKSDSAVVTAKIVDSNNTSTIGATIVYGKPTLDTTKITSTPVPLIYNNDLPPPTLLVNAVMKVYAKSSDPQPEHVYQDTLSVGSLP